MDGSFKRRDAVTMLYPDLDRDSTLNYVRGHWFTDKPGLLSLREKLAERAEDLADRWATEEMCFVTPMMRCTVQGAWHVMMLNGALDQYGQSFEDIVTLTNLEVAQMLASITPDNRLPRPQRILAHVSDLGQAGRIPQIIRLVQLAQDLSVGRDRFLKNPEGNKNWLKEWLPDTSRYLDALWRVSEYMSLRRVWEETRDICTLLTRALDRWQKRAQIIAQLNARLEAEAAKPVRKKASRAKKGGNGHSQGTAWNEG